MATAPEKTEEQKKLEAKQAADTAAADAQQSANDDMSRKMGKPVDHNQQFSIAELIQNNFTDKAGKPDLLKWAVTALGGLALGTFAIDLGPIGMAIGGAIGMAIAGFGGSFLIDMLRHDDKKPLPGPVRRPDAPDANAKVITSTAVTLPAVADKHLEQTSVSIPTYNPQENPAPQALREEIEKWRAVVGSESASGSATNKHSREMLAALESQSNQWETNMRYVRDTLPAAIGASADKVDAYLTQLSPEAKKALSVKLDANLADVPGQKSPLTPELEAYGLEVKASLIQEMAQRHGTAPEGLDLESKKTIDSAWGNLGAVAKRNLISNFAQDAIHDVAADPYDIRNFFPEYEKANPLVKGGFLNLHDLNPISNPEKQYVDALSHGDYKTMATILQNRLADDANKTGGDKLSDEAKAKMKERITAYNASIKSDELQAYIAGPLEAEIGKLKNFEQVLDQHKERVDTLQSRMQQYAKSGNIQDVLGGAPAPTSLPEHAMQAVAGLSSKIGAFMHIPDGQTPAASNAPNVKPVAETSVKTDVRTI